MAGEEVLLIPIRSSRFPRYFFSSFQSELALRKGFDQSEDASVLSILCLVTDFFFLTGFIRLRVLP